MALGSSSVSALALEQRIRREILHKSELIPSLPEVVLEVLSLVNDRGAEIEQFESLLKNDGPLVAKMLRVVNSPFYAVSSHVTSIGQAVMVLGFRSLRSLVLAASTANYMERDYGCYGFEAKGLWKHAIAVASGARTLASHLRKSADTREAVFVAGLLHDIGKMLLAPYLRDLGKTIDPALGSAGQEREYLGIDHQEAGKLVAEKWALSPMVCEVLAHHHNETCAPEHRICHAIVRVANQYSNAQGIGLAEVAPDDAFVPEASELDILGLNEENWLDAAFDMREAVEAAQSTLSNLGA